MPRIPSPVLLNAYRENQLLPLLLRECRSLDLARNELRWLRGKALSSLNPSSAERCDTPRSGHTAGWRSRLRSMCRVRSQGMPLQYILGDQPFGELEILCRKGVLIPRPETESYTFHTAKLILDKFLPSGSPSDTHPSSSTRSLRILDLCTGTGCIPLLLHSLLASHLARIDILGVDLSPAAIQLAIRNLRHNLQLGLISGRARSEVHFRQGNVLGDQSGGGVPGVEEVLRDYSLRQGGNLSGSSHQTHGNPKCDVLISNPPYISPSSFRDGTTTRSVRVFEPTLALVPPAAVHGAAPTTCNQGDLFYHHLVALAFRLRTSLAVLECGDCMQAGRVVSICQGFMDRHGQDFDVEIYSGADASQESRISCHNGGPRAVIMQRRS